MLSRPDVRSHYSRSSHSLHCCQSRWIGDGAEYAGAMVFGASVSVERWKLVELVGWAKRSVPTIFGLPLMVGAAQARLCPPYRLNLHRRLRPIAITQMPLHQLAGRRARQLGLEVDAPRAFDRRQMFSAEH